jgi:hypothetical protein
MYMLRIRCYRYRLYYPMGKTDRRVGGDAALPNEVGARWGPTMAWPPTQGNDYSVLGARREMRGRAARAQKIEGPRGPRKNVTP